MYILTYTCSINCFHKLVRLTSYIFGQYFLRNKRYVLIIFRAAIEFCLING